MFLGKHLVTSSENSQLYIATYIYNINTFIYISIQSNIHTHALIIIYIQYNIILLYNIE